MIDQDTRNAVRHMDTRDIDELVQCIQIRRETINLLAAQRMRIGTRVSFTGKRGRVVTGTVTKFQRGGRIDVSVCSDGVHRWRIPAGIAEVIS